MKKSYPKILRNRKRRIQRRLDPKRAWSDQAEPMMRASNIHYEMAEDFPFNIVLETIIIELDLLVTN